MLDAGDPFGFPRLAAIPVATRLTYTDQPGVAADLRADDIVAEPSAVRFTARTPWGVVPIRLGIAGTFNVRNALAALAAACATGADLGSAVRGLEAAAAVTGRMELVELGQPFAVVVDYAHTADALETVLRELRRTTSGRLWVVFGSAGERDVEKRSAMGSVAARHADISVITDEDPRGEDRTLILEQIAQGAVDAGGDRGHNVLVIPDREEAIGYAIANAAPGDTVLAAGKGHEKTLETASGEVPWNERAGGDRGDPAADQLIGWRFGVPARRGYGSGVSAILWTRSTPCAGASGALPPHADAAATHAASAPGAPATSAQSCPPTRTSGSASSQSTGGGAVARDVARSNPSRTPSRRPKSSARTASTTTPVRSSSPAAWMRNPVLRRSESIRVTDRSGRRIAITSPGTPPPDPISTTLLPADGAATSSNSCTSTTFRAHIWSRGIEVRLSRADQRSSSSR